MLYLMLIRHAHSFFCHTSRAAYAKSAYKQKALPWHKICEVNYINKIALRNFKIERIQKMKNLNELFSHSLRDMYWVENKLHSELPKMAEKAQNPELKQAFLDHQKDTEKQMQRLEKVFEMIGLEARKEKCDAMDGILKEGEELMEKSENNDLLDAVLISAGNKVEHYEIATYGTLRNYANKLGLPEAARLFQESLDEESAADEKISGLADMCINEVAMEGSN